MIVGGVAAVGMMADGVDGAEIPSRIQEWLFSSPGFVAMLICGQIGFVIPPILAAVLSPEPFRRRVGLVSLRNPVRVTVLTALGSVVPLLAAIGLAYGVAALLPPDDSLDRFFEQLTPAWGVVFVAVVALAPGITEEMLFRGYIQRRLLERWGPAWAIGVTTVLFALAHIAPPAMALALPLGAWLGYIAWKTGSIVPCIVCHAAVNGGLNAWRLVIKFADLSVTAQVIGTTFFIVVGVVCFVLACRMLAAYPVPGASASEDEAGELVDEFATGS